MKNSKLKTSAPILYVVHEELLKIVKGKPLIEPRGESKSVWNKKLTKFGEFYGSHLQFNLYDEKNMVAISVYWDCARCYDDFAGAAHHLNKLIEERVRHFKNTIKNYQRQKKQLDLNIEEGEDQIKELEEKLIK